MKEFNFVENQERTNGVTSEGASSVPHAAAATKMYKVFQRGIPMDKWPELSKEDYIAYWNGLDAFRMKQARNKLCGCPKSKIRKCDGDCEMCPFYQWDKNISLDAPIVDDEGNEDTLMNRLVDENTPTPEEALLVKDRYESLYRAIGQLYEEDQTLILMTLKNKPQIEIAKALGLKGQSNVRYRKQRAFARLQAILIEQEGFINS